VKNHSEDIRCTSQYVKLSFPECKLDALNSESNYSCVIHMVMLISYENKSIDYLSVRLIYSVAIFISF
jgi:hypothetical protein